MAPSRKEGPHARRSHNASSRDGDYRRRKKNKPNPFGGGNPMPKKYSVAPLKTRIRDLRRQLERVERLPADVRVAHERELATCERELAATEAAIKKDKMLARYKMVRFFESQKATRHLNKIRRQIEQTTDPEEQATLKRQVHIAEVDLNYTKYYPLLQPYYSLYPKKEAETNGKAVPDEKATSTGVKGDPTMWKLVEKATADGALEALRDGSHTEPLQLRSRRSRSARSTTPQTDASTVLPVKHPRMRAKDRRSEDQGTDMDDSDGGFFETDSR